VAFALQYSRHEDLQKVAVCYQSAFPKSLSTAFGERYVIRTLEWFLAHDQNFLFHLSDETNGNVVGFCGGMVNDGIHPRGSASEMIQFAFEEGLYSLMKKPWLFFHTEMRSKYGLAFRNLRKRFIKKRPENYKPGTVEPFGGLVVIGVDPEFQNRGVGAILLREFERKSVDLGFKKLMLSVGSKNQQAIRSYEKSGWERSESRGSSISMSKILQTGTS
jgi:ribosomal protein S18 acetylase RimI-like enzyme